MWPWQYQLNFRVKIEAIWLQTTTGRREWIKWKVSRKLHIWSEYGAKEIYCLFCFLLILFKSKGKHLKFPNQNVRSLGAITLILKRTKQKNIYIYIYFSSLAENLGSRENCCPQIGEIDSWIWKSQFIRAEAQEENPLQELAPGWEHLNCIWWNCVSLSVDRFESETL